MPEHHAASNFVSLFPTEEVPRILQNVQNCCSTLKRQGEFEKENSLSKRLYLQLCLLPEYRRGPIVPLWESWLVNLTDVSAEITGRADILFLCGGLETYFLIEAKRLFVAFPGGSKDSLVQEYIKDGMMRFVSGQYASKIVEGAMLGYIFNDTTSAARAALDAAVTLNATELRLAVDGAWQASSLVITPPIDETRHDLDDRDFTLYHILTKV